MTDYVEACKLLALGLTAGVLSGLFGIGGGLVIVPALMVFFAFPQSVATGTSLFVILFPTGILGVLEHWKHGNVRAVAGIWITLGLLLGAYVGAVAENRLSPATMKRLYAVFLLVVAAYLIVQPVKPRVGGAQVEAKEVPPEAAGGPPDAQVVH
jgi:uncharacterized protein